MIHYQGNLHVVSVLLVGRQSEEGNEGESPRKVSKIEASSHTAAGDGAEGCRAHLCGEAMEEARVIVRDGLLYVARRRHHLGHLGIMLSLDAIMLQLGERRKGGVM